MAPRLELQALLKSILGSANVYYQPPASAGMKYPAIVYMHDDEDTIHAGNLPYRTERRYQVTVIDANPDTLIPAKVAALPKCSFDRRYIADQLNHIVYNLFF